ncbi:MAG: DUF4465 domain-containing protein [Flavobacteriales bacterium]|jgi:hypothetical protein|nr:DUF4465 domain-containing protein [Flavobacteriales bacterium]
MKKFYIAIAVLTANLSYSQTVDFESVSLAPESAWDGSDLSGTPNSDTTAYDSTFVFTGGLTMNNQWNSQYGYLSDGWVFSNKTDDTTQQLAGAYHSYAGGGANNSSNYAVSYIGGGQIIQLENNTEATFTSIDVTNNNYAALSMLNGDNLAKKFGGTTGDDEDWFLLDIIGYTANGNVVDTIKFYLADYRFSDNSQDYIIKDWTSVDLSSLGAINKIRFELSSTDNGQFGMNTPAYLAIDNVSFGFANVNEILVNKFNVYPNPSNGIINFDEVFEHGTISVYNLNGQVVYNKDINTTTKTMDLSFLTNGIYTLVVTTDEIYTTRFIKH